MRLLLAGAAFAALSACVSIDADVTTTPDPALTAVQNARVRECPADHRQVSAHAEGFGAQSGVTAEDIAFTPLASDPTRALRLRRITVQPGGVIAWHDHSALQGMALIVSGEIRERRNSCAEEMLYRAGDVAMEDAATAHSWRNDSEEPVVILVSHVVAR